MTETLVSRRQMLQTGAIAGLNRATIPVMVPARVDADHPLRTRSGREVLHIPLAVRRAKPSRHLGPQTRRARGYPRLLERTLVVVISESGRSPKIQTQGEPGRIHWPDCFSTSLVSAGIRGGAVYGTSDKIGEYVKDKPVRPQDLGATIYHALEVSLETRLGKEGVALRPFTTGEPIKELFG